MDKKETDEEKIIEFIQPKIILKQSLIHGVGVFATQDIVTDEIIERCPMIPLAFRSRYHTDPQIYRYLYTQPLCPCQECQKHGLILHMVLGYGMIYNHQDNPSAVWKFNWKDSYAEVIANQDIKADQEIYVNYGPNYFKDREKIELDNAKNS
jgi:hypothetical protein